MTLFIRLDNIFECTVKNSIDSDCLPGIVRFIPNHTLILFARPKYIN